MHGVTGGGVDKAIWAVVIKALPDARGVGRKAELRARLGCLSAQCEYLTVSFSPIASNGWSPWALSWSTSLSRPQGPRFADPVRAMAASFRKSGPECMS